MQTACGEIGAGPASFSSQPNSVDLGIPEYANARSHENGWAALNNYWTGDGRGRLEELIQGEMTYELNT